jgi:hypothetical protein
MSLPDQVAIRCDICGWVIHVREDDGADRSRQGYPEPLWPAEWGTVTVKQRTGAGTVLQMDACGACMKQIPDAIRKIDQPPAKPLDDRSDNFDLTQIGEAAKLYVPVGDAIDFGQLIVKAFAHRGYGIFKLPTDRSK